MTTGERCAPSDSYLSTLPNNKRVTEGKQYEDTWKIIKGYLIYSIIYYMKYDIFF